MTLLFDVNSQGQLTGPQTAYKFKTLLVSAGWVVKSSGDGLAAFSSTTDVISSGSSGANGWNNTSAWVRIQSPAGAGTREFTLQRNAASTTWTIKYSYSAGFTGGSPSSTVPGTATDSQTLLNATTLFATDNTYRVHIAADNASPYGFYMFSVIYGGQGISSPYPTTGAFLMDPLLAGSFPSADVDPVVFHVPTSSAFSGSIVTSNQGYLKKGLSGEGFVVIPWTQYFAGATTPFPSGVGNNAHSQREQGYPVPYARSSGQTAPFGWKGLSSFLKWLGAPRACPSLLSQSSSNDRVTVGDFSLPWNGGKILI